VSGLVPSDVSSCYHLLTPAQQVLVTRKMSIRRVSLNHTFRRVYIYRVGQNSIYTPYMTVYLVISQPKKYIHRTPYIYGSGQPYVYTVYIRHC